MLWAELNANFTAKAVAKPLCSLGFLLLALSQGLHSPFAYWVFIGLLLSLLGDVFLLGKAGRWFLLGLVAFLLAHGAYIVAFAGLSRFPLWGLVLVAVFSSAFMVWLWPHLAGWRLPVLLYCLVISMMLWAALGVGSPWIRWGAVLFYASDTFVARARFVKQDAWNWGLGLPLYYIAQYLLAWALG